MKRLTRLVHWKVSLLMIYRCRACPCPDYAKQNESHRTSDPGCPYSISPFGKTQDIYFPMYLAVATLLLTFCYPSSFAQTSSPGQNGTGQPPSGNPSPIDKYALSRAEPAVGLRGQTVTVSGEFPRDVEIVKVELKRIGGLSTPASGSKAENPVITEVAKSLTFRVPANAPLGKYEILVTFSRKGNNPIDVPLNTSDPFRITAETSPKITAIYPTVSYLNYPEDNKDTYEFKIIGEGFSHVAEDNMLIIEGISVVPLCTNNQNPDGNCARNEVSDGGRQLQVWGIPKEPYGGPQKVRVRVGDQISDPVAVTLSRVGRATPTIIAFVVLALLLGLIAFILRRRRKAAFTERNTDFTASGGMTHTFFSALLLDPETNTYSLSKFQFYAWTIVVVLGYAYLTAARSLVRWDFTFPDLPDNLPGIVLIAVSTSALAVGITSAKGSKGSGDLRPSMADLLTSGGVISAERLQFFVWTVIGALTFIFLTFSVEPGKIEQLPSVPEKFLYLMGISSFGYLGGKLARKPGPKITQIEAERGSLVLTIHGENLSPDATFKIDGADLQLTRLDNAKHPDGKPEVKEMDVQTGFAKLLRLVIATPESDWEKDGKHIFTLINPNGEKAEWVFEFASVAPPPATEAPTITAITPQSGPGLGGETVKITGTNFTADTQVMFGDKPATEVLISDANTLGALTPPHDPGAVDVVVQNAGGSAKKEGGYTFSE